MTDAEKTAVVSSADFQALLANDEELNELEKSFYSDDDDAEELRIFAGGVFVLEYASGTLAVSPPSAGVFALLWSVSSPFVRGGTLTRGDVLVALYVLAKGRKSDFENTLEKARAFAEDFLCDEDYQELANQITSLLDKSLRPYATLLPSARLARERETETQVRLDADWLAGLVLKVHRVSGLGSDAIIWELPMASAALYDCEYRKYYLEQANIKRRITGAEAIAAHFARAEKLAEEFLIQIKDKQNGEC